MPETISPPHSNQQETVIVHRIQIQTITVLKLLAIVAVLMFAWFIREVIGIIFAALILASALDPWVDSMARHRIPRGLSILGLYIILLTTIIVLASLIIPPLLSQFTDFLGALKDYAPYLDSFYSAVTQQNVSFIEQLQSYLGNIVQTLSDLTAPVTQTISGVFSALALIFLVLVITFYMTVEEDGIKKFVRSVAPLKYQPYLVQKINRIQIKMGAWLRGQLILMLIIGGICFIGLAILGVPYALVLGVLAGFLEFVPYLGPILSAVPAVFFAYAEDPWKALAVVILYFIVQQLENQLIVPKVMEKAVGLNPIVVICAMLVGHTIVPYFGILLAVPATTIVWIFLEDIFKQKQERDTNLTTVTLSE